MSKEITKHEGLNDVEQSDIVRLSRKLLDAMTSQTNIMNKRKMSEEGMKEAKLVHGFLNLHLKAIGTKMQFFKMIGLTEKIKAVKDKSKTL